MKKSLATKDTKSTKKKERSKKENKKTNSRSALHLLLDALHIGITKGPKGFNHALARLESAHTKSSYKTYTLIKPFGFLYQWGRR